MGMNREVEKVLAVLDGFRMCGQMDHSAYSSLYDMISALDVPEWISVKDRYPDAAGVAVLVSATSQYGQQHVFEAFIGYGDFNWYTMDCTKMENRRITCNEVSNHWKITHWMPLPEPQKEGSTDETHA